TTATAVLSSSAVKVRPDTSLAVLNGPRLLAARSTPTTVIWVGNWKVEGGGAPAAGSVNLISVSTSPPASAATACSRAIAVTADPLSDPNVGLDTVSDTSAFGPGVKKPPPPGGVAEVAVVTVMSVPTPYRLCKTRPCAVFTPEDMAVTVMTRAI